MDEERIQVEMQQHYESEECGADCLSSLGVALVVITAFVVPVLWAYIEVCRWIGRTFSGS